MQSCDVYVCLISAQATPNLVPLLSMHPVPQTVLLLVTKQMQVQAQYFQKVLHSKNIKNVHFIELTDSYAVDDIRDQVLTLMDEKALLDQKVIVNITGGTKLMSLAAHSVFSEFGVDCFYFSTENQWMNLQNNTQEQLILKRFKVEDLLQAQGYNIVQDSKWAQKPVNKFELTSQMIKSQYSNAISELYSYLATGKDKKIILSFSNNRFTGFGHLQTLLDLFKQHGLISIKGNTITFVDEAALRFAQGTWFEEHIYHVVKGLPGIQDVQQSVQIESLSNTKSTEGTNELDVVFTYNNHLHVIECKTVQYDLAHNKGKDKQELHRLVMLKQTGGLATKALFASYKELNGDVRGRAAENKIQIIEAKDLSGLKTHLKKWLGIADATADKESTPANS